MTPKYGELEHDVERDVEARVRQGVKAVLEEVLEEEMAEHLQAGHRELTPTRRGERNDHYQRNLLIPAEDRAPGSTPRPRGRVLNRGLRALQADERDVEEAICEMYLSQISVRKIAGVTDALSRVRVGKDAVSRIASRLEEESGGSGP